ncbi:DNA polymerase IV [Rubritalea halochordaticola]|uniref:DNA polymerase IV n=2 Tax=Rubritalea halochordaticola TaxID=714537 RepID=A0ABP9UVF3_9BACT
MATEEQEMRKIIHIDMDCFYAAIEQRDFPELRGKPIAVGGSSRRGVLCTASYEAREYGCRSAMPVFKAMELCPQLIIVPTRFDVYQSVSAQIRAIFGRFANEIEPLSLDEAYLDVSHWSTSGSSIASEIRRQIYEETGLTASAGVAPNKLLAKIASDLNKPNGQFVIQPEEVEGFMRDLPVSKLWGVGKRMQEKLERQGIRTCSDMQKLNKIQMAKRFARWGLELYEQCRGIDHRAVTSHRSRKSISKETTFSEDINQVEVLLKVLRDLLVEVRESYEERYLDRKIKSVVVKLKFADFTRTTVERAAVEIDEDLARELLAEGFERGCGKSVRLLGAGVRLADEEGEEQLEIF